MDLAMHYLPNAKTQKQTFMLDLCEKQTSIGLVKGDRPIPDVLLCSPEVVQKLTEQEVKVFVQRGYASHTRLTDMDYANAGAEIVENFIDLSASAKILLKFSPFTNDELQHIHEDQIVVSRVVISELTTKYLDLLIEKKAFAIAINLITDRDNWSMLDNILISSANAEIMNKRLSLFILPLLEALVSSKNFRAVVQTNPALLQSIYCFKGVLCNKEIADRLDVMWKDILSLCLDLN
ncbi:MAG: hypothetical protein MJZ46_05985 [Bacteroidales bacterium]|nr:hypothetical protein [Bacteroidales bacterium]